MNFLAAQGSLAHWRLHVLTAFPALLPQGLWANHHAEITTAIAALFVGIVVGITGMGGGALMTPALIFLGVGNVSSIVTADLTAAAIYKTGGAAVHWRCGAPNLRLAALLICSSVPMAFLGPHLVRWITPGANIDTFLMGCIGIATLLAATTYAWRLCAQIRRRGKSPRRTSGDCGASAAYSSDWRAGRTPGRCYFGRVRFAHHDHPTYALSRASTRRHGS